MICTKCKQNKEDLDFFNRKDRPGRGKSYYCKACYHNIAISQERKNYCRARYLRLRNAALVLYGNQCACCKEKAREFLAFDHIHGGGTKERREMKQARFYMKLAASYQPEVYRILCHNCNSARGYYGYCPHERNLIEA